MNIVFARLTHILRKLLNKLRFIICGRIKQDKYLTYGIKEAILFPVTIDGFLRYADAVNKILEDSTVHSILEIGSGGPGILRFLSSKRYNITLLDVSRDVLLEVADKCANRIVANGCKLPFRATHLV